MSLESKSGMLSVSSVVQNALYFDVTTNSIINALVDCGKYPAIILRDIVNLSHLNERSD